MPGTFSYSFDPGGSDIDAVRFLTRDTTDPPYNTDEEITWLISQEGNRYLAAAAAAEQIALKFSTQATKTVGDLSISAGDRAQQYAELSKSLRLRALRHSPPTPYQAGQTSDDKDTDRDDTDLIQPAFRRGVHDNPGVSRDPTSSSQLTNVDRTG
jgi:hypothetical protein